MDRKAQSADLYDPPAGADGSFHVLADISLLKKRSSDFVENLTKTGVRPLWKKLLFFCIITQKGHLLLHNTNL